MSDQTITGLQELQRWNARAIANMKPSGSYGRAVQVIVTQLQRYEMIVTHVDTGALRVSQRMSFNGLSGRIYLDPSAKNPRTGKLTSVYGAIEEARGGSHAFYRRTVSEAAPRIVAMATRSLGKDLT